jgi:hypothetical protein
LLCSIIIHVNPCKKKLFYPINPISSASTSIINIYQQ